MSRPLWIAAALLLALAGCGGGDDQSEPKRVARIEVSPASLVLTGSEPTSALRVRALAEDGTEVENAPIAFTSSRPGAVQVDPQGRVVAVSTIGSALIEVSSGDVVAAPVPVVAARPKPGVVMLADDEIVGEPVLIEALESVIGSRVSVTVRRAPAPAVGTMLLASEGAPLAGRVVEVVSAAASTTTLIVEVVRLDELFDDLQIETVLTPDQTRRLAAAPTPVQRSVRTALADRRSTSSTRSVRFGNVECKGDLGGALLDINVYAELEDEVSIRFSVGVLAGRASPFIMAARYAYTGKAGLTARLGKAKGELACNLPLFAVPIPVPGFLQLVLQPNIPIDAQVKGDIDVSTNVETKFECGLNGSLSIGLGFDEQWQRLDLNDGNVDGDCSLVQSNNPDFLNPRISADLFLGLHAGLVVDSWVLKLAGRPAADLLEGRTGFSNQNAWSLPAGAALDTRFNPDYRFSMVIEVAPSAGIEDWFRSNFDRIADFDISWTASRVLGRSPTAKSIHVDRKSFSTGETVVFTVTLDPFASNFPSVLGAYNVQEVRIYRVDPSTLDAEMVASAHAADGQLDFRLEWVAEGAGTSVVNGVSTFHAFAVPRLWTALRDVMPLELGAVLNAAPEIRPARAIAAPGTSVSFEVFVEDIRRTEDIVWSAAGGSISQDGTFLADANVGDYLVTATDRRTGASSTSLVTIAAPPSGFFVTGTVLSEDGRPIGGARIDLVVEGVLITAQTESDGLYHLGLTPSQYGRLPPSFVVGASNVPIHHPAASEVKRSDGSFVRQDFVLVSVASNPNLLSIELVPDVHHLGNSNFSGTQNSQFQHPNAEGASFSKQFFVSATQRSQPSARLRLIAKGVQCPNIVQINGSEVTRLGNSLVDGSYSSYDVSFDPAILIEGANNTFMVTAATCTFDMDDFEFAHAQIFFE